MKTVEIGGMGLDLPMKTKHDSLYLRIVEQGLGCIDSAVFRRFGAAGDVVLDAGANIGFVALRLLALGAAKIHAFEPVPAVYARLSALRCDRIETYPLGLGDTNEDRPITLSTRHDQGHTFSEAEVADHPSVFVGARRVTVPMRRLDDLSIADSFDYMKVDIEGMETAFLAGARETILRSRTRVLQLELRDHQFDAACALLGPLYATRLRVAYVAGDRDCVPIEGGSPRTHHPALENIPPTYVFENPLF